MSWAPQPAPDETLVATDRALSLRIDHLRASTRPTAPAHRWLLTLAALSVVTTPLSLLVLPLS